ncbi:hypothetical protein JRO89_XS01G0375800 [Xanthoceras sorbifolium]|uniref:Uncharacterized protein n=1 Tax=Xanthoceras sorbifolium TaxID=99658 RepID=A0ABQ8INU8_9ROSI|nr:hypothetical protein JRO89_XS01G0375800 [Xanthoceras sorbifolium]
MHVCSHSQKRETEGACPLLQDPQWPERFQTVVNIWERTVIFNARICCDVDLEVGNLIRIHKPWKEVQVSGNDESIILSTYFSQI